jgi:acetoin utilization deacetylase AcuC-like enzyme
MSREEGRRSPPPLSAVWIGAYGADIGAHVFPTGKYRRVRDTLVEEGTLRADAIREPDPAGREQLARVHTDDYLRKIREKDFTRRELLTLEVPLTDEFRRASLLCAGGSVLAARTALEEGVCLHIGGGFHHAFPDHGEGFCLVHDVAVAIREVQAAGEVERAAVVDCDVHHGNGTAAIFADDDRVFTFSMHQERNYPFHKPPGDLDLGLRDGIRDDAYLGILEDRLPPVLERHRPELVFYLAGADPYGEDQLGGLSLTKGGLRARDERVLEACRAAGAPVAVCLAGGYAVRLRDTVEIHCNTGRACAEARARR